MKMYKLKQKTPQLPKGAVLVKHEENEYYVPNGMQDKPTVEGYRFSELTVTKMKKFFAPATKKDLEKFGVFSLEKKSEFTKKDLLYMEEKLMEGSKSADTRHGTPAGFFEGIPIEDMRVIPDMNNPYRFEFGKDLEVNVPIDDFNRRVEGLEEYMTLYIYIGKEDNCKLIETLKFPGRGMYSLYLSPTKSLQYAKEVLHE